MTLNGVIALILSYFTAFDRLGNRYVTVLEDRLRPIARLRTISDALYNYSLIIIIIIIIRFAAEYLLPVIFRPKLTQAAVAQYLCDS